MRRMAPHGRRGFLLNAGGTSFLPKARSGAAWRVFAAMAANGLRRRGFKDSTPARHLPAIFSRVDRNIAGDVPTNCSHPGFATGWRSQQHYLLPLAKIPALVRHSSSVNGLIRKPNFELSGSMKM